MASDPNSTQAAGKAANGLTPNDVQTVSPAGTPSDAATAKSMLSAGNLTSTMAPTTPTLTDQIAQAKAPPVAPPIVPDIQQALSMTQSQQVNSPLAQSQIGAGGAIDTALAGQNAGKNLGSLVGTTTQAQAQQNLLNNADYQTAQKNAISIGYQNQQNAALAYAPLAQAAGQTQANNNITNAYNARVGQVAGGATSSTTGATQQNLGQATSNAAAGDPRVTHLNNLLEQSDQNLAGSLKNAAEAGIAGAEAKYQNLVQQQQKTETEQSALLKTMLDSGSLNGMTDQQVQQLHQSLYDIPTPIIQQMVAGAKVSTQTANLNDAIKNGLITPQNYKTEADLQKDYPDLDHATIHNAFINGNKTYLQDQKNQAIATLTNLDKVGGAAYMPPDAYGKLTEQAGYGYAVGYAYAAASAKLLAAKTEEDRIKAQADLDKTKAEALKAAAEAAAAGQTPEERNYNAWAAMPDGPAKDAFASETGLDGSKTALTKAEIAKDNADTLQAQANAAKDQATAAQTLAGLGGGGSVGLNGQPAPAGGFRTDRNNNPTAMTTDVAKSLGLVEGTDYVKGDSFKGDDGQTYYTAKLLGDPIDTTIKALDTAAANGTGAFYTASGAQRWTHTGISDSDWQNMSADQKRQTVIDMYHKEGGSGSLSGELPKADYKQYGLLANTDFNPSNQTDKDAWNFLSNYLNSSNGSMPTAASLGISLRGNTNRFSNAKDRASELFTAATGESLPDLAFIKSNKALISGNNKLQNTLDIQSNTIAKNFALSLQNVDASGINQNSQPINSFINYIKDQLGDPEVAQYLSQNVTLKNEAGNLLALKNASGTTVGDKLEAAGLINPDASEDQMKAVLKTLLQEAQNASDVLKDTNTDLYKQIDPLQLHNRSTPQTQAPQSTDPDHDPLGLGVNTPAEEDPLGIH